MNTSVERHFSRAAQAYHQDAELQRKIARQLCESIHFQPEKILEIGCGTGFLTEHLIRAFPNAAVSALDISPKMIELARLNIPSDRAEFLVGDFLECELPRHSFDLVTSSSSLQWIRPLDRALKRAAEVLRLGGTLASALFSKGTLGDLHDIRQWIAPQKPMGVRLPDRTEIEQALQSACFGEFTIEEHEFVVQYKSVSDFFSGIRRLGFTAVIEPTYRPLCPGEVLKLRSTYAERCGSKAGFNAAFVMAKLRNDVRGLVSSG